jgi:DNA-binding response OmpR family regulator
MKKILIVEDDRNIASALAVRLTAAGHEVHTSFDGHEGLLAAVRHQPDLIISDIWMPEPMGFLGQQRLAALGLAGVPVIYMTASKKTDLRQIAEEEGAYAFFEKPYDAVELLATVTQALSENRVPA